MIETMHAAHGVGLAAQQVGLPLQLTVLDVSAVEDRPSTLKLSGKDVDPKSAAAERGFKEGDVILEVAGKSVANAVDVREAINAARADNKNSVLMRVKSGGSSRFVAVPLAKG